MKDKTPLQELRENYKGSSIHLSWWSPWRTIKGDPKTKMVSSIKAEKRSVGARKKIYHIPAIFALKEIEALKERIYCYWKGITIPFPQESVRLIKNEDIAQFDEKLLLFSLELQEASEKVQNSREAIIGDAILRLGESWNPDDYPTNLSNLYRMNWDYPNVTHLQVGLEEVGEAIFERQRILFESKMEEAIQLSQDEFTNQFLELCTRFKEILEKKKPRIHQSTILAFKDFFERFKKLSVGSNEELEVQISMAKDLLEDFNYEISYLRDNRGQDNIGKAERRTKVKEKISEIKESLEILVA